MVNDNIFNFSSIFGENFTQEKVFETIANRFEEYKDAYKKSSSDLMNEATEQLVQYVYQTFIKFDTLYTSVLDYVQVIALKTAGDELTPEEKEVNTELNVLIKTISDTIPHDKETHVLHLEFIKLIIKRAGLYINDYLQDEEEELDEDDDETENNDNQEEDKHIDGKKHNLEKLQGALSNVKLRKPNQDQGLATISSEVQTSESIEQGNEAVAR